jgi:hypothetical protein
VAALEERRKADEAFRANFGAVLPKQTTRGAFVPGGQSAGAPALPWTAASQSMARRFACACHPPSGPPGQKEAISLWLLVRSFAAGCTAMTGVSRVPPPRASRFRLEQKNASQAMRVVRLYAGRWEVLTRSFWNVLAELSSPSLSRSAGFKVLSRQKLIASEIKLARRKLPSGRPGRRGRQR